jgi:endo-1,4-beta-xylanase
MLRKDADYKAAILRECGAVVPENEIKWDSLRPTASKWNFAGSDCIAKFAADNGLLLRGHPLVWHEQLPAWLPSQLESAAASELITAHIQRTCARYPSAHSWDVVNEPFHVSDGRSDCLRRNIWLDAIGENYIDLAFHSAAEAAPDGLLMLNEFGLERADKQDDLKRNAVLEWLSKAKARGVPVHGLGIQAHLTADKNTFDPRKVSDFMRSVEGLGLRIVVTELDVDDSALSLPPASRDSLIASIYKEYLSVALDNPGVIGLITWGLSDRYSWLRSKGAKRPLLLNENFKPKRARGAIAQALANTFIRPH